MSHEPFTFWWTVGTNHMVGYVNSQQKHAHNIWHTFGAFRHITKQALSTKFLAWQRFVVFLPNLQTTDARFSTLIILDSLLGYLALFACRVITIAGRSNVFLTVRWRLLFFFSIVFDLIFYKEFDVDSNWFRFFCAGIRSRRYKLLHTAGIMQTTNMGEGLSF